MKERFRNLITTIIGTMIMLSGVLALLLDMFGIIAPISIWTIAIIELLGWLFVAAKDTLLEGLTFNLFKLKKSEG